MNEKTVNIDNFIGVYDNYISPDECRKAIELFDNQYKFNNTVNRIRFEDAHALRKKDEQFFAMGHNINTWWTDLRSLIANFDLAFKHYLDTTGGSEAFDRTPENPFHYSCIKLQKTLPTEGYHIWHIEHGQGFNNEHRAFVYSVYLNDVEEGGETEFLHFSKRVKPKAGRIVIWPASFPYVHRGNPPISGEKYLLTSWMNLRPMG